MNTSTKEEVLWVEGGEGGPQKPNLSAFPPPSWLLSGPSEGPEVSV